MLPCERINENNYMNYFGRFCIIVLYGPLPVTRFSPFDYITMAVVLALICGKMDLHTLGAVHNNTITFTSVQNVFWARGLRNQQ